MVYDYIKENGIHLEENYPYVEIPKACKYDLNKDQKVKNLIKGYVFVR